MGNTESCPALDDAETPIPSAKATATAYATAAERASAIAKGTISDFYQETRDQKGERSKTRTKRDEAGNLPALYTVPLNKIASSYPEKEEDILKEKQDIETKHVLQKILNMNAEEAEATAAVYHYLETNEVDNELSPSGRAREVIGHIKEELQKGNCKPAYQFLATAKTVLPVLREEEGLQLEAEIFSEDSEDSDYANSVSDQTAAIFRYLDGVDTGKKDPLGSKNVPITIRESDENIFRILEEREKANAMEQEVLENNKPIEDPGLDEVINFNTPSVEDMDLEFVENFDLAYTEFLYYHPKLVGKSPELMKSLRIYKLQKLLEHNELLERRNIDKFQSIENEKSQIEQGMQSQLKDAMERKAARQTFLEAEVNDVNWKTRQVQAKLRWKVLKYAQDRARRQQQLRHQFESIPQATEREDILELIPDGPYSKKLEKAIKASFIAEGSSHLDVLSERQEEQLREYQLENSMLNSEITMLSQKLGRLQSEAKKLEWVQSTLAEMKAPAIHRLKMSLEKKDGVTL